MREEDRRELGSHGVQLQLITFLLATLFIVIDLIYYLLLHEIGSVCAR